MYRTHKNDEAVSPVIGTILMIGVTVILAAVVGAFVFGMANNIQSGKVVMITAKTTDATHIEVMNMGGQDVGKLTEINISGNVTADGTLGTDVGNTETFVISGPVGSNRITAVGTFNDGSTQVLLDTII